MGDGLAAVLVQVQASRARQVVWAGKGAQLLENRDLLTTVYLGSDEGMDAGGNDVAPLDPLGTKGFDGSADIWALTQSGTAKVISIPSGTSSTTSPALIALQIAESGLALDTTVQGVRTNVATVNTTLGAPAQDATVGGVTTAVGQVKTTLGTPAQDATVTGVSTAVGSLHTAGKTVAGELAVTSLTGTGLAKSTDVQAVNTTLGTPAQTNDVVTTLPSNLATGGVPNIAASSQVASVAATALAASGTATLGPYTITKPSYDISFTLKGNAGAASGSPTTVQMQWFDSASGLQVGQRNFVVTAGSGVNQTYIGSGPTRGNQLQVVIINSDAAFPVTYSFVILQNSRNHLFDDWQNLSTQPVAGFTRPNWDPPAGILGEASVSVPAGTGVSRLLPLYCGTVFVSASTTSGTNDAQVTIFTLDPAVPAANATIAHFVTSAVGTINQSGVPMPRAQCYMFLGNSNAAAMTITCMISVQEQPP